MWRVGLRLGRRIQCFSLCIIFVTVSHIVWRAAAGRTEAASPLTQPQIIVQDGHIYFLPAQHKNLILRTSGRGKVVFNNLELDNLVGLIHNSSRDLNTVKSIFGSTFSSSSGGGVHSRNENIEQTIQRLNLIESLEARLTHIERQVLATNGSVSGGDTRDSNRNRINRLTNRVEALENRLNGGGGSGENPCNSNPCRNGGICIPTIYGAFCYCPKGWEGDRCDHDVNECWNFAGTELGCQNGGTCVNQPGSYQCQCVSGFIGLHCTKRSGGCSSASGWELCGHGICIDQNHGVSSQYKYTCICDVGWTSNERNPACIVDVDECFQYHTTCSKNPPVSCINTPGSYVCGPCPPGYSGNGHRCTDINECLVNNGGCSVNPMVQCINTVGSKSCGPCPPGYMGTGMTCQYVGLCQMNNGGCYPLARCVENPMVGQSFVQCVCPAGYTGPGIGLHGCIAIYPSGPGGIMPTVPPSGDICLPNPCENGGVCHSYGVTFSCSCSPGFVGQTCSTRANPCISQPCQNGGTCQQASTGFSCTCPSAFTGDLCERQTGSCGGYLVAEEGSLKYPQNMGTYDHRTFCEWQMRTGPGKVFNITFTNFHLEGGSSCGYDYLEIRDGTDSQSPLLGRFCGEELPNEGNIISTHNAIHFLFRSDHSVVGLGFEFSWNSTEPVCGGILENQGQAHGTIQSPGYPGAYPHNRDCTWEIKASLGKRLQLIFATFQLESHQNCSFDYVEIRDGLEDQDTDHAPILAKLCSTTLPAPMTSSGPYLTVRFHSDDSGSDQGFMITYSEVAGIPGCGGLLTSATAIFSSPQHPQPYSHGLECDWLIRLQSVDERISLKFITFELEESPESCSYDYVEVHDGPSLESPLLGRFCGNNLPPTLMSSGNRLFVRFKSDESVAMGGFSAKYEAACGGEVTSPDGILRSPYYPSNYPKLRDCIYVINQPDGKGINLQFLDFDIEPGRDDNCLFDYLEIRDGDNENSTLIGHYCGPPQAAPEMIMSSYNYLWLGFKTDGSVQNRGFMANFSTFETGCGGIMRAPTGVIQSPSQQEAYPHGLRCMWVIRGDPGQIVRITWDMFNLEGERGSICLHDYVEIYDNSTSTVNGSGLVGRFCGNEHPPTITSLDATLTVIFKWDRTDSNDGFMASYQLLNVSTACGGNYFTEYGMIQSPRYPGNYPNGRTCTWVITATRGRQIELNIMDFAMEDGTSSGCRYDSLEIRNGPYETSPLIGQFCGDRRPPSRIPSFSNSLYLEFKTDSSHTQRGFHIIWDATSTGCGGVLNSPSGSISSSNYPSPHGGSGGIECIWKIQVNQGNAIQLMFVDLDLQRSGSESNECWGEHVEILDGPQRNSPSLGKFCSQDQVISTQSTGNSLTVKLVGNVLSGSGGGRGFLLNYKISCNRTLKGFHGVIESPNYPNQYPPNSNCTWRIEAGRGNKLNISFSHFDVGAAPYQGNCSNDFIQMVEWDYRRWGPPLPKTAIGTYCGSNPPGLISSTRNTVDISFISNSIHGGSGSGNGFRLEWAKYGCGGRITADWAVLKSPDYPMIQSRNVECVWEVATQLGTKVQLTVYSLDGHLGYCDWDSLEVYGGADEISPLLSRLCSMVKESSPTILLSHGNRMYIRFHSDGGYAGKGFYGMISQIPGGCGGTLQSKSGYIYSPNYPLDYDRDDDCSWLVRTDENHVVELTFEDFAVGRHSNCSYDHVAVYDGDSTAAPLLLMHCGTESPQPNITRSSGNEMLIHLKTDGSAAGRGFKAKFKQASYNI